ncbi:Strumpellin [Carabus blaptoides fortunei]
MTEFLAENNTCGQTILQLVSRGNAIIAELLRLKDYIPPVYKLETKQEQQKYADIILDFSYFKASDLHDHKIDNNSDLQDLDEEFRENYLETITRFYLAFESIHTYISDLNHFIEDLDEGMYIQQSVENVFLDFEGKQLMCESLYLYGIMLLVTDFHIDGLIRERLLVSYYRYSPQRNDTQSKIDDVCKLLRTTGFSNVPGSKRPNNYPEDYFKRIPINSTYIDIVIGRLRSDDIYGQISTYPLPEHRSTALANQAAMLYVVLFFFPSILNTQTAKMREIVDKYFPDNWIVSIYMGITVNLIDSWEPYKAAKAALSNTLDSANIKEQSIKYGENLKKLIPQTRSVLKEGSLSEEKLMDNVNKVINVLRECNVTLRWLMLHTTPTIMNCENNKKCVKIREQVITDAKYNALELFELLLNTAQFELKVKEMFKHLLAEKDNNWENYKKEGSDRMNELAEVFSGTKPLTRIDKNESLQAWFADISKQITSLSQENNASARKIVQLIQALEEVQEFHQLETHLQVKQFLTDTRRFLHQMIRIINIKEEVLITLQIIGDLSYAWELIESYTNIMQKGIKKEPSLVIKLRATFLKLASALEIPLLRINQAHSEDLESVSKYYSNELVSYVRKVLQIIPQTMFGLLAQIIHLQTAVIKELPTRLEKDKLREYAQLDERFEVAKLTYSISVFSEGIQMMEKTLVGVICIDPRQLLEDGIRKELVRNVSEALHTNLIFNTRAKISELEPKLKALSNIMSGYKRSFEYIQDYVNINGLKIWQEELSRIVGYNVEQECNSFLRNKIHDWESLYQSKHIPIPRLPSSDNTSVNFIGCLGREILRISDPKSTIYVQQSTSWYDFKTHKEILNIKFFSKITSAISPAGVTGLDRMYAFTIVSELQKFLGNLQKGVLKDNSWLEMLTSMNNELENSTVVSNPTKLYTGYNTRCSKVWPQILEWVLRIGHLQLLRKHLAYELNTSCKFNSKNLESSLRTLNEALLVDIRAHYKDSQKAYPGDQLMYELSRYLDWAGIYNPNNKIYVTTTNIPHFAAIMFLFVIAQMQKLVYCRNIGELIAKRSQDQIDGFPFINGVQTVLKQFHPDCGKKFLEYLGQYVLSHIDSCTKGKPTEFSVEATATLHFLETYIICAGLLRADLNLYIPEPILCQYRFLASKVP